ncbi:MAG: hypothetical protein AB1405_11565 [Bdellovibrionota bacterium]
MAAHDRRVIPINPDVRAVLGLYLSSFRNYDEAAHAVGVSKDTIAKYFEGNPNIAFYVFKAIAEIVQQRFSPERLHEAIPHTTVDELLALAHERNGQQIDNVMYEISPPLLKLLQLYTEQFPSRARAAQKLEVNPRTFKAYLKGDIRSFPRRKFERLVALLEEKGFTRPKLEEAAGVSSWEELLSAKVRLETLQVTEREIIDEIRKLFETGMLKNELIEKRLRNAASRVFGSLGEAMRAAMKEIETELLSRIETDVEKANFASAFKDIRRLERHIQVYAAKERAVTRSAGNTRKKRWKDEVFEMSQRKNKFKKLVFQALRLKDFPVDQDPLPASEEELAAYSPERTYHPGDILLHPEFGLGHVLRTEDRQCVITFGPKVGEKTLIMSERRGGPEFWQRPAN